MRPISNLDVFILTFNAAKREIDIPVFARHLYNAFGQNASSLPELLAISLQEMAPLAQAFIGSYVLNPYFQRYESAVNTAAAMFIAREERQSRPVDNPYTLITTRNVGMTGILLFARELEAVQGLRTAEVGFGAGDMANKGAVGLRILYRKDNEDGSLPISTELTFVSAHLAAMEWNLSKRNKNWESIVSGLIFEDPKKTSERSSTQHKLHNADDSETQEPLLGQEITQKAIHDVSIYKPGSHLFISGDLNYRVSKSSPAPNSTFPNLDPESPNHFSRFLSRDQLNAEKAAGRTLHGLSEAPIKFPPTYKLVPSPKSLIQRGSSQTESEDDGSDKFEWSWAVHRWPSWCDRILFLEIPWWARETAGDIRMNVTAYDAFPAVRSSDHRAVFLRLEIPMLEPAELLPTEYAFKTELGTDGHQPIDPRIKLPFPIDFRSRGHRAQVKKWESTIGWLMLVSQSKQGIVAFVVLLLVGLGTWWYQSR
ncbi:DNase I-like protein [Annulohypoxylon maeteangense]|uniref:DNase I-like protein n=1 Tax=Annulohypoxylon maeteangense TaxID=1927788 RepID=UPI002008411C|nr:DNase I-like protein [Annulohypoxylon maeteangense]KAI0886124.1 DNase I-like protein [Annulohypoxylon maeteangense]